MASSPEVSRTQEAACRIAVVAEVPIRVSTGGASSGEMSDPSGEATSMPHDGCPSWSLFDIRPRSDTSLGRGIVGPLDAAPVFREEDIGGAVSGGHRDTFGDSGDMGDLVHSRCCHRGCATAS